MDAVTAVRGRGGVACAADLIADSGRSALRRAVATGNLVRLRRGVYGLPELADDVGVAASWAGVLSHRSAALRHGWAIKAPPSRTEIVLPRNRRARPELRRPAATLRYRDLEPWEVVDGVTEPVRTVVDCARDLPLDEALCVADSALRCGAVVDDDLGAVVDRLVGPGSARARRLIGLADARAANPLESTLRAICLAVPSLRLVPQCEIAEKGIWAQVDLADRRRRLVVEAEGYATHGTRAGFDRDIRRYTELTAAGWTVLRFTWTQVMFAPDWVRAQVAAAVDPTDGQMVDLAASG